MSSVCKFKNDKNEVKEFTPKDILFYGFTGGKNYTSKEIKREYVFLEYIFKGKRMNIYYMRDYKGDHYFLDKDTMKFTELPYQEGYRNSSGTEIFFQTTKHIDILSYYFQDVPELQSVIYTISKPDHDNLIRLAEAYQKATGADSLSIIYERKIPSTKLFIEPTFGYVTYRTISNTTSDLGVNFHIWLPRMNEKLYVKTGIELTTITRYYIKAPILKFPLELEYIYPKYRIKPKASLGYCFIYNLKQYAYINYTDMFFTLNLNGGLNYEISKHISLSLTANTEYTDLFMIMMGEKIKFNLLSYSLTFGLLINI